MCSFLTVGCMVEKFSDLKAQEGRKIRASVRLDLGGTHHWRLKGKISISCHTKLVSGVEFEPGAGQEVCTYEIKLA